MQHRACFLLIACAVLPAALVAQASKPPAPTPAPAPAAAPNAAPAPSANPVSDALRNMEQRSARNLIAAAEAMPADKYNYRPTPAQMSFALIQVHLATEGNDVLCSKTAGVPAPQRTPIDTTASKEQLVARLKETFQFCEQAFAKMDDSKLAEPVSMFRRLGRPLQSGSELPAPQRHLAADRAASKHVVRTPVPGVPPLHNGEGVRG